MEKTYNQGLLDGVKLYGSACSQQGVCEGCPVMAVAEAGLTCQQFAAQNPAKMASILKELTNEPLSYYNEYCLRFPNCNLSVEALAVCACRKVLFEGRTDCEAANNDVCLACWKEPYTSDVTEESEAADSGTEEKPDDSWLDNLNV